MTTLFTQKHYNIIFSMKKKTREKRKITSELMKMVKQGFIVVVTSN